MSDSDSATADWELAPAPESAGHVQLQDSYDLFIGGKFVKSSGNKRFDSINPATEQVIAKVTESTTADVDKAVKSARNCYDKHWSRMSGAERGKYIFRIARMMQERARELSVIETMDGGKPIRESRDVDIPLAAAHFFYYAGWADKLQYAFPGRQAKPIGVDAGDGSGFDRSDRMAGSAFSSLAQIAAMRFHHFGQLLQRSSIVDRGLQSLLCGFQT